MGEGVKAGPERDQGSELELRLLVEGEWRRGAEPGRAASERWVRPGATPAAAEHRAGLGAGGREVLSLAAERGSCSFFERKLEQLPAEGVTVGLPPPPQEARPLRVSKHEQKALLNSSVLLGLRCR